ncbi:helix-turn-helix domain-containing protein [Herbaspirillum sp. LeCh32-8]|uniref:RodZ domain-containing protein n=1 Tax=Herbaspirillum sp. LeCh32-8 TaxID=2821356 RepID=UPI001AEB87E4|nr:RodZ domain-containing protein [Herbaspirillum sp. LeCh32-8]MBP0599602.1 helix-turn-helix domain-containing protein [Herbaspirillum sp. LeCh32-8]
MSDQQMNEVPSSQPQEDGQPAQAPAAVLPGAALAAQRQKKGWTVEQVASLVKLSPRQIQAIEADNYSALPGLAVARGFVRSYAKAVGLDANVLTSGMPQESPVAQRDHIVPQHSLSTPFSEGPLPAMMMSTRGNSSPVAAIVGVVVIAVAAGAAAVRWTDLGENVPQLAWLKAHKDDASSSAPEAAPEGAQAGNDAVAGAASSDTPVNARVETITPTASDDAAKEAAPTAAAVEPAKVAPVQSATPSASVPAASAPAATAASTAATPAPAAAQSSAGAVPSGLNIVNSKDLLRLSFREDSWVEIRRADKTTVISRLLKAGTTEAFDVSDATTLVIGNAAGVDATLRGQPLDLKAPGGSNVARLNLN